MIDADVTRAKRAEAVDKLAAALSCKRARRAGAFAG